MPTMLYKAGSKSVIDGEKFDYIIVDESDITAELKNGWRKTTPQALELAKKSKRRAKQDNTGE